MNQTVAGSRILNEPRVIGDSRLTKSLDSPSDTARVGTDQQGNLNSTKSTTSSGSVAAAPSRRQVGAFGKQSSLGQPLSTKNDDKIKLDNESDTKEKTKKIKKPRKHRLRNFWSRRSLRFKIAAIILVILLASGAAFGIRLYNFLNSVFSKGVGNSSSAALNEKVKPEHLNTEGDGRLNILLMGRGGNENEAPDLTDTMMIASIDLENQNTSLLSIPRDTWVNVSGSSMKINAVYSIVKENNISKGKKADEASDEAVRQTISAVRNVAGVPIHKYLLTDYAAFRDTVNAVGGVDINVPGAINDTFTGWKFKSGMQHMDGLRALQYARSRHGSQRGDFDRNEHQRQLLVAIRQKATSTGIIANPVKLNNLANAIQKNIRTDLSVDEAKSLYERTKNMADDKIQSLDLAKPDGPLVATGMIGNQSVVLPSAGAGNFSKIRAYARTNMMDPWLRKEAPTVAVYNGTGRAGMALTVADVLSSYGYKVVVKETSKSKQTTTTVVKKTSEAKPFTERFLSLRFKTSISNTVPDGALPDASSNSGSAGAGSSGGTSSSSSSNNSNATDAQFIIVLGSDFSTPSGPTW